ncbi:STT3 domain-containing protein [Candidatus Hecatella orcuttiae]|uniref:STT3 domain-containing protein n=1 Tax=Candidatus Hecatella orcuttiae TaxID=1935119 RepID=UPI0028682E27|nr:STT3 domain-containing protein [Candidatus Hecatella orcuttiae]
MTARKPVKMLSKEALRFSLMDEASKIAFSGFFQAGLLALIAGLAFTVRILPLQWGAYLSEFDPYWHFYVSQHIVEEGLGWIFKPEGWRDFQTWYPFGRDVPSTTPMGLPLTAAAFFFLLKGFGLSLLDVAIFLPPTMAAVTCVAIFFLGKEVGGRETGLLASLFLAFNNAYASRTVLGFFKHESVGILAIVSISLFFLKALDSSKPLSRSVFFAVLAGLALGYLNISWGAFYYMMTILPLFLFAAIIFREYSSRLFIAYYITLSLGILIALPFPRPGLGVIASLGGLAAVAGFLELVLYEGLRRVKSLKSGYLPTILSLVVVAVGALILSQFMAGLPGKVLTVLDPSLRVATQSGVIMESVAEHRLNTWASFYMQFGNLLILAPLGFYFAYRRKSPSDLYLILFGVTTLYAAASLIRLNLILAPAFSLLSAFGVVNLAKPAIAAIKKVELKPVKKVISAVNPKLGLALLLILLATMAPTFYRTVETSEAPATIASSSVPIKEFRGDWLEALEWIRGNVPENTPIISWWDYGYWIALVGKHPSVADNATINVTQIAHIGQILLSEEAVALDLSREYFDTDYILIFVTTAPIGALQISHLPWGYGDEGKWVWMARIAQGTHPEISVENADRNGDGLPDEHTLLGKVILYSIGRIAEEDFEKFEVAYVSPSHFWIDQPKTTTQVIILKGKA